MLIKETMYDLNDVMLLPNVSSDITSRANASLYQNFHGIGFKIPIVSSPMSTVTEIPMAKELFKLGSIGIIHRLVDKQKILNELIADSEDFNFGYAVGLVRDELDNKIIERPGCVLVCIDVANGYTINVRNSIIKFKQDFPSKLVMSGNVVTAEGFKSLSDVGTNFIRIGIGGGSVCDTPAQTSIHAGYATMIDEIRTFRDGNSNSIIVADGGMKSFGDISKAIALGADLVMLGSMLSNLKESAGSHYIFSKNEYVPIRKYLLTNFTDPETDSYDTDVEFFVHATDWELFQFVNNHEFNIPVFKQYYGMSSAEANKRFGKKRTAEGVEAFVQVQDKSVTEFVSEMEGAIGSTLSYVGIKNLFDLYSSSSVKYVTPAVYSRAMPHINK